MFRRYRSVPTLRILTLGVVILAASPFTRSEETYPLKLAISPGEKWTFDVNSAVKLKGQVTASGQPLQQIDQSMGQRRKGTIEVLSADAGLPTAMKVTFDNESANTGSLNGEQSPAFALAGKTVTVKRSENGAVANDLPEPPDEATLAELNKLLDPDISIYPKQPVAVGDEWDGDTAALIKQFQLGPDDKASLKCKLLALSEIDGHKVADVRLVVEVTKREQGSVATKTTLGGVSRIDLKTGETLVADILGKISTRGSQQVDGSDGKPVNCDVTADGTLEVHQKVSLLPGADSVPAKTPAATHLPPAEAATNTASPFTGSYQGGGITVELAGVAARYNGTLALKEKKFPLVASAVGNKLTGTFESEGTKFTFTALLDGATLFLSSEGTTYTLRRATANSLAHPTATNPSQ